MKIVTTGAKYTDIDSYAGCIAYAELLNFQGEQAIALGMGTLNKSIPQSLRGLDVPYETEYIVSPEDEFVLIDISDIDGFKDGINPDSVVELIDHHPGFEDYWHEKIGDKAHIEFIGAACTLVYERWERAGFLSKLQSTTAKLLAAGILDNTLNFRAAVTTERDKRAYAELCQIASLPNDWPARYFAECQQEILQDVSDALQNDSKTLQFSQLPGVKVYVGQLAMWDAQLIQEYQWEELARVMAQVSAKWFVNVISISEGMSYFIAQDTSIQNWAEKVLDVEFIDYTARANRLWLRKEIIKADMQHKDKSSKHKNRQINKKVV